MSIRAIGNPVQQLIPFNPIAAAVRVTTGFFLNDLFQRVQNIIDQAANSANLLQLEAGRQISLAIENAKNAYSDCLDQTVNAVNAAVQGRLQELAGLVQQAQSNNDQTLTNLINGVQTVVNTIPFANTFPQVTRVEPRHVDVQNATTFRVSFRGNFPTASTQGGTPTFEVNGTSATLVGNTTNQLDFQLPANAFATPLEIHPLDINGYPDVIAFPVANQGELKFPKRSWLGWLWTYPPLHVFRVTIWSLPHTAGTLKISWIARETFVETRRHVSRQYWQCSARSVTGRDVIQTYAENPTPNWTIIPGTSTFNTVSVNRRGYSTPKGRWNKEDMVDGIYRVMTRYMGRGNSGDVTFTIGFDEERQITENVLHHEEISCAWGQFITRTFPAGTYPIITFTAFDRRVSWLPIPTVGDRFVTVLRNGNNVNIQIKPDPQV